MAVYRKTYTKPLPAGAELLTRKGERFARWQDGWEYRQRETRWLRS